MILENVIAENIQKFQITVAEVPFCLLKLCLLGSLPCPQLTSASAQVPSWQRPQRKNTHPLKSLKDHLKEFFFSKILFRLSNSIFSKFSCILLLRIIGLVNKSLELIQKQHVWSLKHLKYKNVKNQGSKVIIYHSVFITLIRLFCTRQSNSCVYFLSPTFDIV